MRRDIRIDGKHTLTPLWKIEVWKMETVRTGYCGNCGWETHEGITARSKKKCVFSSQIFEPCDKRYVYRSELSCYGGVIAV
jgi:hypothetical protein